MKIQTIKTNKLKLYPGNPRTISERMFEKLQQSINTFGIVQPLVVNPKMQVIGGNQRLLAIRALGIESVPVVVVDLPKDKEKALNIALNKITGQFDVEALKEFFADIDAEDIELTGFSEEELQELASIGEQQGWDPAMYEEVKENGDGIAALVGYSLSSFWKDIKNKDAAAFTYMVDLPLQNKKAAMYKYSRANVKEIERIIKTYMREGDYFLENCAGWATFSAVAKYYGYNGVGVDIWDKAIEIGTKQISTMPGKGKVAIIKMDGAHLTFANNSFDYVYTNPPFLDEEKYSKLPESIESSNLQEYEGKMLAMLKENYRVLKPGGLFTLTINDARRGFYLLPIHNYVTMWAMQAGFKLWDIAIAEVFTQRLRFRKKDYELKHTAKAHEYVITFKKAVGGGAK